MADGMQHENAADYVTRPELVEVRKDMQKMLDDTQDRFTAMLNEHKDYVGNLTKSMDIHLRQREREMSDERRELRQSTAQMQALTTQVSAYFAIHRETQESLEASIDSIRDDAADTRHAITSLREEIYGKRDDPRGYDDSIKGMLRTMQDSAKTQHAEIKTVLGDVDRRLQHLEKWRTDQEAAIKAAVGAVKSGGKWMLKTWKGRALISLAVGAFSLSSDPKLAESVGDALAKLLGI